MLSLKDLLTPESEDETLARLLTMLSASGFPVTAWQPGGAAVTMLEKFALLYAEMATKVRDIALGGFLRTAVGSWLTLLASDWFAIERIAAVATEGILVLRDAGAGPHTIVPSQLTARYGDLRFVNTTGGTLPANGQLALTWRAKAVGASFNAVPTNVSLELGTSVPGVTVRADPVGVTLTWITTLGSDEEDDASLASRCAARWPKLGRGGGTYVCYDAWAREASAEVKKVYVAEHTPIPGKVTVYVYGANAPVTGGAKAAVDAYLNHEERRPLCVAVIVSDVSTSSVVITGTIRCKAAVSADVVARANAVLAAYEIELGISQEVIRSEIIERIMGLEGVVDVNLTNPVANIDVPVGSVARFTVGLTKVDD